LVSDDELSAEIEALVSGEVNPALAAHGGFVTYMGHDGEGTAYMTMGGGCHGCSMSKMTMLEGVQTMLQEKLPAVERGARPHGPTPPERTPSTAERLARTHDAGSTAEPPSGLLR
jgi:Fe-S cluster biogenesis protein NfuA